MRKLIAAGLFGAALSPQAAAQGHAIDEPHSPEHADRVPGPADRSEKPGSVGPAR